MGLFKKKQSIDPVEFLVLRNELVELKERLDASEQAKASLEDRLSSLAATTMVLSSNAKSDTAEIVEKIESIENRLETTLAVSTKVDELHQRVIDVEQSGGGTGGADVEPRLAELSSRLDQVAELAAAPVAPDDELAGRLDKLTQSAETVELLQRQIGQINARMSAQADIADQVTALSDRVGLLQQRNVDSDSINQRLDELAASAGTTELSERLALLGQRLAATEEATRVAAEQESRLAEQLAALDERVSAAAEQAAGVSQLGERIDTLVATPAAPADLDERIAELMRRLDEQAAVAGRVDELESRVAAASDPNSEIGSLRQIVELRSADVAGLRELIDVRSSEIAEVRASLEQLRAEAPAAATSGSDDAQRLAQQLGELAERVAITAEDARAARERANGLAELLDQLGASTSGDELHRRIDELSGRVDEVHSIASAPADTSDAHRRIDELAGQLQSTPAVPADVQQRLDELAGQVHELRSQTPAVDTDAIQQRIDELAARVDAVPAVPADVQQRLDELAGQVHELRSQTPAVDTDAIQQRIDELAARVDAVPAVPVDVQQRLDDLAGRLSAADDAARQAREQAAAIEGRLAGADLAGFGDQLSQLWAKVDASEAQARQAQEQAAALAQQLAESGDRVGAVDARVGELAGRLDGQGHLDQQIAEIWSRIVGAEEQTRSAQAHADELHRRLDETASSVQAFADTSAQANTAEIDRQLAELRARLEQQAQLPDRLADLDRRLASLPDRGGEIQQLHERISELTSSLPDTQGLSSQLSELSQRVSSSETDARAALAQASALDERIQNVSTQLANQLGELSREMDSLASRPQPAAAAVADDAVLQTLRSGQVKLASEQARYEISFREDLAALAEQVRQLRGRS